MTVVMIFLLYIFCRTKKIKENVNWFSWLVYYTIRGKCKKGYIYIYIRWLVNCSLFCGTPAAFYLDDTGNVVPFPRSAKFFYTSTADRRTAER